MAVRLQRRRFTVGEYDRMVQAGVFLEDDRVEFIAGEIVEMAPVGIRHAACVRRLIRFFSQGVGERAIMDVQNPVRVGADSEPQPNLTLLRPRSDLYASRHPGPGDLLLVVEVAETTADTDRQVKIPLYARAGVPEVWLVDLGGDCIEVYQEPTPEGYGEVRRARRGERVAPAALPDLFLAVEEILG